MTAALAHTAPARPPFPESVRLFQTSRGQAVAIERSTIGFIRDDEGRTLVGLKIASARPMHLTAAFADVFLWWTSPALKSKGFDHAADG